MKKLVIKKPIPAKKIPESGFYLELTFMHGDADGYTTEKFGPFLDTEQDALINLIEILEKQQESQIINNPEDTFDEVPGLYQWFEADCFDSEEEFVDSYGQEMYSKDVAVIENLDVITKRTKLYWADNPDGYGDKASLDAFSITYFNEFGIEYDVELQE